MPKRTDIKRILLIGAGPIVIGQACEFDYAGVQACKALKAEGYEVILVNSNPATIMTDPSMADATYIEPVDWRYVEQIIAKERPDALLPTMGGQTALNTAIQLYDNGVLEKYNVELIGATPEAIHKAEDRQKFRTCMLNIGLEVPRSGIAHDLNEALAIQLNLGFPVVIRPSFTLGGSGGGIAYNRDEFIKICERGLELSPTKELLIDESLVGWKEFEMEVVRDSKDNCIIVCGIENLDPMGIHTGDSITVAPIQTLTDREYQVMRDASIAVLREIGVATGGSNVQFAVNPDDGRMVVIEMNPRVSRSSALASKATGFPIAKVAAKLAVGYTLDELRNEITGGQIPAAFEPTIDYVVTKIPRFNFEKFPHSDAHLTTQMKSVGEVMSMGRTFQESLQKAIRGLEISMDGLVPQFTPRTEEDFAFLRQELYNPGPKRLWYIADAFRAQLDAKTIHELTHVDPWFLAQIEELVAIEQQVSLHAGQSLTNLTVSKLKFLKRKGFADSRLGTLLNFSEESIRHHRQQLGIKPVYKRVDSVAAEFQVHSAYMYSTYGDECEAKPTNAKKVIVLGGGPNRIGQGIEFDYCCVHAVIALREAGYETIMINCNPETVSTDYDTSDRLYFEPLTLEDVLAVVECEQPYGVIVQYGGQTPLKLARALEENNVPIIGTSPEAIDRAEDRERFADIIHQLKLKQPENASVRTSAEAIAAVQTVGFPVVVRPSYVLGGRAMQIVYNEEELRRYMHEAQDHPQSLPILIDRFLDQAIEVDVDAVCDGHSVFIGGLMEHIEQAGVHSGDSACTLPLCELDETIAEKLRQQMTQLALALNVVGLVNAQFAVRQGEVYVLEVNPRASRTVPFVSKATGIDLGKVGVRCMIGQTLKQQGLSGSIVPPYYSVKAPVFPFVKFPGVDPILGPEMKSTGEVMGIGENFGVAFAKAQLAAGNLIPTSGRIFISVRDTDKAEAVLVARLFYEAGFTLVATGGTAKVIQAAGIPCEHVNKVAEGRPHIVDIIKNDEIALIINTTEGTQAIADSHAIRASAVEHNVYYTTTIAGAKATYAALRFVGTHVVMPLQHHHQMIQENSCEKYHSPLQDTRN